MRRSWDDDDEVGEVNFLDAAGSRGVMVRDELDDGPPPRWCGHDLGGLAFVDGYDESMIVMCEKCAHFADVVAFELGVCSACGAPTQGAAVRGATNAVTTLLTATAERPLRALPGFVGDVRVTVLRLCESRQCVAAGDEYWRASKWAD